MSIQTTKSEILIFILITSDHFNSDHQIVNFDSDHHRLSNHFKSDRTTPNPYPRRPNYIRSGLEPPNRGLPTLKKSVPIEIPGETTYNVGLEGGPRFGGGY